MTTAEEVLSNCKVEGMIVKLPELQLDRSLYLDVKKRLELIGGQWKGGKTQGFVFPHDPSELLSHVASGEKRNLKKEFQFFATPDIIADQLVELANLEYHHSVLEPSAGQGAIINAIHRKFHNMIVDYYELMELNHSFLDKIENAVRRGDNFLTENDYARFDRVIANPPFSKNQDIDHIMRMYSMLKVGGRLISIASKHWEFAQGKKEDSFRAFLKECNATIIQLPAGTFKESGTEIEMRIIVIDKTKDSPSLI